MKKIMLLLSLALTFNIISGCRFSEKKDQPIIPAGSVKTGFAVISSTEKSTQAAEGGGAAQADSTFVAVTVNNDGRIIKCFIDGVQTKINFNSSGKITTSLDTTVRSKLELGDEYGMRKASPIGKEWNEQIMVLSDYVQGKTVAEIRGISLNEKKFPTDQELASSVTIAIMGYIDAIEKAVDNAQEMGAAEGDKLGVGTVTSINKSKNASDTEGQAQAYSNYAAVTFDADGRITSCIIDGSQTDVNFDSRGRITSDLAKYHQTKNELGRDYGMHKVSPIGKEWNEQADTLSKYVVGKTVEEVKAISVNEKTVPQVDELTSSVTMSIGEYLKAIEKAYEMAK